MWRNQDLGIDKNYVDVRYLLKFFAAQLDPGKRHDVFELLVLIIDHVTQETVAPALLKKIVQAKKIKNSDMVMFHRTGIVNQEFAVLTGLMHTCAEQHQRRVLQSNIFLQLKSSGRQDLDEMLAQHFSKKQSTQFCKACGTSGGYEQQRIIEVPGTLLIVVDQFDQKGMLKNLLKHFPMQIDLKPYIHAMSKDDIQSTVYDLGGFIKVQNAPILNEYTVCLRKHHADPSQQWFVCNNRGTLRLSTAELFKERAGHQVQMLIYKVRRSRNEE